MKRKLVVVKHDKFEAEDEFFFFQEDLNDAVSESHHQTITGPHAYPFMFGNVTFRFVRPVTGRQGGVLGYR